MNDTNQALKKSQQKEKLLRKLTIWISKIRNENLNESNKITVVSQQDGMASETLASRLHNPSSIPGQSKVSERG